MLSRVQQFDLLGEGSAGFGDICARAKCFPSGSRFCHFTLCVGAKQNTQFWPILLKRKKIQNFLFLTKNHELTLVVEWKIFDFFKSMYL